MKSKHKPSSLLATNRIRCHCENAHRCQCPEESLSHLRNSSALPIETPSYNLTKEDDSVMTITEEGEFVLTLDSKILVNASEIVTKKKCEIQTIDLTGCYNCEHGARLVTRCRSQLDIRVTVVCKTFEFVTHCGPMNVNKTTFVSLRSCHRPRNMHNRLFRECRYQKRAKLPHWAQHGCL
ncbi:hypothetical protein RB195_025057 [Necator americanus]|uniref:Phlebovirus glycoprotein G2 fusion domain-containing protein n=1 Tax=Necator americanus TaxID=51031 RepID=A0ABR1EQP7_NECAM